MPRIYCDVHGTPMFMQQNYMACTTKQCDRISLNGKTCISRAQIFDGQVIDSAVSKRMLLAFSAEPLMQLMRVLGGEKLGQGWRGLPALRTSAQKIAFLRQTDSLFNFPEQSLGTSEVNKLRVVHAGMPDCVFNKKDSSVKKYEKVVRVSSKKRKKVFRWSGLLEASTVGIGAIFRDGMLTEMDQMSFYDWCSWGCEHWSAESRPEDPMWDCPNDKEWRMQDMFVVPEKDEEPLIIKAMGESALVVDQYCWFLGKPLASADKHKNYKSAVIQANQGLMKNGIIASYKPRKKEQAHVALLRNYLGGKIPTKKLLQMQKPRRIEF